MWIPNLQEVVPRLNEVMKYQATGGHPEGYMDRDVLVRGYEVHSQNVREAIPADRLLEFHVKDGWEPLCNFLGVPIPDVPFPYINDRVRIVAVIIAFKVFTSVWPLALILPILCFTWLVSRLRTENTKKIKTG